MKIETGRVCPVLSLPQHTNKPMFSYVFIKTKVEKIELKIEEIVVIKELITVVKKTPNPMGISQIKHSTKEYDCRQNNIY